MLKRLRIAILLLVLIVVALGTWSDRLYSTNWDNALRVVILPINGDGSAASEQFIKRLSADHLQPLETFFAQAARQYGITLERPVRFSLGPQISELPPMANPDASVPGIMAWSLRLRYYAWRTTRDLAGPAPDVRIFVQYHDPQHSPVLPHSLGLQKGLIGVVYAFAARSMHGSNDVIVAHELLHTLGATDKYDANNLPVHPHGYAEPERSPLHPQRYAELMGGRIPSSPSQADTPESLHQVRVGELTAREIGWIEE